MPSPRHNFKKDLEKIKQLSSKIEKRLSHDDNNTKIDRLTTEQLQDLDTVLRLANYLLNKYEDDCDLHDIFKEFVDMICSSASLIESVDGDIDELVLSAEKSISQIKESRIAISDKVDFDASYGDAKHQNVN